jgi:hypothetical protein
LLKETRPKPDSEARSSLTAQARPTSTADVMTMGSDGRGNVAYCPTPEEFDTSKPILLGGSRSDHRNQTLCNQIIKRGWFRENIPDAEQQDQYTATCAFPASVKPADAVEGGLNRGYV